MELISKPTRLRAYQLGMLALYFLILMAIPLL